MFEKKKFIDAVMLGDVEKARELALRLPKLLTQTYGYGESALYKAITKKDLAMAKMLVEAGARPDLDVSKHGNGLCMAARENAVEILGMFCEAYPHLIDAPGIEGYTPLMFAAHNGNDLCLSLLLSKGAKIDLVNMGGKTAQMIAVELKKTTCAHWLEETAEGKPLSLMYNTVPAGVQSQGPEGWQKLSADRIAYVASDDLIGLSLKTVFNFATREITRVTRNLESGHETHDTRGFGELADIAPLQAALREIERLGSAVDMQGALVAPVKLMRLPGK
jgi:hypothetical protein